MYGVPAQLDLTPFVGTTLDYIGLGKYQLQFYFTGDPWAGKKYAVTVEGYWEVRDAQSVVIDKAVEIDKATANDDRDAYRIHHLLGHTVAETKINPPESFTLVLDNGWTLTFVDDASGYESCHIYIGDSEIHI
jgi:hypothetical protein